MRRSPPIAPHKPNQDTYIVLDDFGARLGRAWRETTEDAADRGTVIRNLIAGEYSHPIRIISFNTAEGWSRDVTMDIADEVRRRFAERDDVPDSVLQFYGSSPGLSGDAQGHQFREFPRHSPGGARAIVYPRPL